uniref:Uncharacterized protein n=1 Tax=Arundo donax TaxID=35708 RepID=A0A0A9F750_ARUDO
MMKGSTSILSCCRSNGSKFRCWKPQTTQVFYTHPPLLFLTSEFTAAMLYLCDETNCYIHEWQKRCIGY